MCVQYRGFSHKVNDLNLLLLMMIKRVEEKKGNPILIQDVREVLREWESIPQMPTHSTPWARWPGFGAFNPTTTKLNERTNTRPKNSLSGFTQMNKSRHYVDLDAFDGTDEADTLKHKINKYIK